MSPSLSRRGTKRRGAPIPPPPRDDEAPTSPSDNDNRTAVANTTKKTKVKKVSPDKQQQQKTPWELYFDQRNEFRKRYSETVKGWVLIKGLEDDDEDDDEDDSDLDEEEKEEKKKNYTWEEMNSMRVVVLTPNRADQLEAMEKLVLADQYGKHIQMFDTRFSYHVEHVWQNIVKPQLVVLSNNDSENSPMTTPSEQLDLLFAFTYMIQLYDVWMYDHEEDGMGVMVKELGTAWRRLLSTNHPNINVESLDAMLGWDVEYTKPAILEMLNQFQSTVNSVGSEFELGTFRYSTW